MSVNTVAPSRLSFIRDEPSIGRHPSDIEQIVAVLQRLSDGGKTLLVVEHDLEVIAADWLIDLGPQGGAAGGTRVCAGTPDTVAEHPAIHVGRTLAWQ